MRSWRLKEKEVYFNRDTNKAVTTINLSVINLFFIQKMCEDNGGSLVSIRSPTENSWIVDTFLPGMICYFSVCSDFIVPLRNLSLVWRRHHCRLRTANYDLCSALMAIEQWRFFSVSDFLGNKASVYDGYFRGPVTLTPIAERLAVELSLPILTT